MSFDKFDPSSSTHFATLDTAARGPMLGFLGGIEAAYNASFQDAGINSMSYFLEKYDDEQAQKAKAAGVKYRTLYDTDTPASAVPSYDGVPSYDPSNTQPQRSRNYRDVARQVTTGDETDAGDLIRAKNQEIAKLQTEHPEVGFASLNDMVKRYQDETQQTGYQASLPHSLAGKIGSFIGGMGAQLDPRVSNVNFGSAFMPIIGEGALARIGIQAAAQGLAETVNQFGGVQDTKELLGEPHGAMDAALSIGGAAVGGAAFQGLGEGIAAGARRITTGRWFAPKVNDIPPPPTELPKPQLSEPSPMRPDPQAVIDRALHPELQSPLATSPMGVARAKSDMDYIHAQLSDWGGAHPWEMPPPTETRIPGSVAADSPPVKMNVDLGVESVDSIARRVDPELFGTYDKLAARKQELRGQIGEADFKRSVEASKETGPLNAEIRQLNDKVQEATPRLAKKYQARIDELQKQVDAHYTQATAGDTPEMAALRQELMYHDEKMRDLAPSVTRAYTLARRKWDAYSSEKARIDKMIGEGDTTLAPGLPDKPDNIPPLPPMPTPRDHVPELKAPDAVQPGETMAQATSRANTEAAKATDEALEQFQGAASKLTDPEKLDAERVKLDAQVKTLTEAAKTDPAAKPKLLAAQEQRDALDYFTIRNGDKEIKIPLDGQTIQWADEDGTLRQLTPRQLLAEMDKDSQMLQAVTTCSRSAIS